MASSKTSALQVTPFGAPMLKHFLFADGYKNLNHGASTYLCVLIVFMLTNRLRLRGYISPIRPD